MNSHESSPFLSFLSHPVLLEKYPVEVVGGSSGNPLHLHGVWEVTFRSQEWHRDMLIPIQLHYGFIYSSYKTNHYFKPLHYDRKIPSLEISEYQQTNLFQFFCKQNAIVKIVLHEKKIPIFHFKSSFCLVVRCPHTGFAIKIYIYSRILLFSATIML